MNNYLIIRLVLATLLVIPTRGIVAQVEYKLNYSKSSIVISGTSTLHNWEMNVTDARGGFILSENQKDLSKLTEGTIQVDVTGIRSESNLMDKKAHEALKSSQFPQIKVQVQKATGSNGSGKATLQYAIAGASKTVTQNFQLIEDQQGDLAISGTFDLHMSEFGISPPVALLGTIKTGDLVTLKYKLHFRKETELTYSGQSATNALVEP
jgi:polyisoprenoid-binding protein YceI